MKKYSYFFLCCATMISLFILAPVYGFANSEASLSSGQMLYVPAYSHIYSGNREMPFNLAVTISIRNINPAHAIQITAVDYYETQGKLIKEYLEAPVKLKPLESMRYVIPEKDKSGGSGANFIVEWKADLPVNPPIVESIMISTQAQQGISFTSRGREVITPEK